MKLMIIKHKFSLAITISVVIVALIFAGYFMPIKSSADYCLNASKRFSVIFGQTDEFNTAVESLNTAQINEGACATDHSPSYYTLYLL
jgi:hypothetical protein